MKRAYLKITTWVGSLSNAQHYYGRIVFALKEHRDIDVNHKLTIKEAINLNKSDNFRFIPNNNNYKAGEVTDRFMDESKLKREAIKTFKKEVMPKGFEILMLGDNCCIDPEEMLVGPKSVMEKSNELNDRFNALNGWECKDEDEKIVDHICKQWDKVSGQNFY